MNIDIVVSANTFRLMQEEAVRQGNVPVSVRGSSTLPDGRVVVALSIDTLMRALAMPFAVDHEEFDAVLAVALMLVRQARFN